MGDFPPQQDARRVQFIAAERAADFPARVEAAPLRKHGSREENLPHPTARQSVRQKVEQTPEPKCQTKHRGRRDRTAGFPIGNRPLGPVEPRDRASAPAPT